jgi:hypothetical protein
MKTSILIVAFFIGWILSGCIFMGIIKYESKLFKESKQGRSFYSDLGDRRYTLDNHYLSVDRQEVKEFYRGVSDDFNKYYDDWYHKNIMLIIALNVIPCLSMFLFIYAFLNYKYANSYTIRNLILTSIKNRVFSVLISILVILNILMIINGKQLMVDIWDMFGFVL